MDIDIKVVVGTEPPHHIAVQDLPVVPNAAGVVTVVSLGAVHNDHGVLGTAAVGQEVPSDAVVASRPDAEGAGACKEGDAAPSRVSEWPAPLRAA